MYWGEDVVASVRAPSPISHLRIRCLGCTISSLRSQPTSLENFTSAIYGIWSSPSRTTHLYMLQTPRNGKRTAQAALQIACDLVDEGMITEQEAVLARLPNWL